jgi:hypothetical protein
LEDASGAKKNLSDALSKDASLRAKAERDLEFRDMRSAMGM